MKITLEHNEIDQALINYVREQGLDVNAGDIEIKVHDGQISASIATSFLTAAPAKTPRPTPPSDPETIEEPSEPDSDPVEDMDREDLKQRLDALGIDYAPKARTPTLKALLADAEATGKENTVAADPNPAAEAEDAGALFGTSAADTASSDDPPPFGQQDESSEDTSVATQPDAPTEDVDDDKPLFGN